MAQKKKIYAVRSGSQTGIFYSWDDCRRAVTGVKGAEYCGFYTLEEAEAYLRGEEPQLKSDIPECPPETAIAFVDGSFDVDTFRYSFGCVLLYPDGTTEELNGVGNNPNAVSGSHHYTSSIEERDYLVSLGWHYEGIGWYGIA